MESILYPLVVVLIVDVVIIAFRLDKANQKIEEIQEYIRAISDLIS